MASAAMSPYYELSWAILSTIGLSNVLVGSMVMGIAGFSMVSLVPLVVSVATAIANGMCYYAFYSNNPVTSSAVASAFADICWLIQEAGLSFYSYAILIRVLLHRQRLVFLILFWTLITAIVAMRLTILTQRLRYILDGSNDADLQRLIDHIHVGYFSCIAAVECVSALFLLKTFNSARMVSMRAAIRGGLFSYLMRSTEIRLALLALVGVTRAVTYSFQNTAQSAEGVAGQLDRFAYTLECLFPIVMFIDILASRLVFANKDRSHETSSNSRSRQVNANRRLTAISDIQMYPVAQSRRHDTAGPGRSADRSSSQEYIFEGATSEVEAGVDRGRASPGGGINRTVEFEISESRVLR